MSELPDEPPSEIGRSDQAATPIGNSMSDTGEPSVAVSDNPSSDSRIRRRILISVSLVIVLALVGGVLAAVIGSPSNADAAVIRAVDHAIGDKTASIDMNENVLVEGKSISFSGSGVARHYRSISTGV